MTQRIKKVLAGAFLLRLTGLLAYGLLHKPQFPSEIVLKQNFIPGQWLYIVQDSRNAGDSKSLRFYVDDYESTHEVMKVRLGKKPPFLISDTRLQDVTIKRFANGLHIQINGAVEVYRSNLYLARAIRTPHSASTLNKLTPDRPCRAAGRFTSTGQSAHRPRQSLTPATASAGRRSGGAHHRRTAADSVQNPAPR